MKRWHKADWDWQAALAFLPELERHRINWLIGVAWRHEGLTADHQRTADLSGIDVAEIKNLWPRLQRFFEERAGVWMLPSQWESFIPMAQITDSRSRAGQASGAARRAKALKLANIEQNEHVFNSVEQNEHVFSSVEQNEHVFNKSKSKSKSKSLQVVVPSENLFSEESEKKSAEGGKLPSGFNNPAPARTPASRPPTPPQRSHRQPELKSKEAAALYTALIAIQSFQQADEWANRFADAGMPVEHLADFESFHARWTGKPFSDFALKDAGRDFLNHFRLGPLHERGTGTLFVFVTCGYAPEHQPDSKQSLAIEAAGKQVDSILRRLFGAVPAYKRLTKTGATPAAFVDYWRRAEAARGDDPSPAASKVAKLFEGFLFDGEYAGKLKATGEG